jgi:membrane-bound serine protease (ClpP class)
MDYLTIALILFTVGVIMLLAEILLPTGGILVVVSLLFFAGGVGIILARGTTTEAVVAIAGLALGLPAAGFVAVSAWRRMSIGTTLSEDATAPGVIPGAAELELLKNRTGKTVSPMRPSGTVEFDGKRVDAMTEGVMLDAGVWVRCIDVKGGKVVVRQMDPPADMTDIAPDARNEPTPDISLDVSPPPPKPGPAPSPPPLPKKPADDFDDLDLGLDK